MGIIEATETNSRSC